jgi:hypothetical protein
MQNLRTLPLWLLMIASIAACGDSDTVLKESGKKDSGTVVVPPLPGYDAAVYVSPAGICDLSECPVPAIGLACCTPLAQCGFDLLGNGASCVANAGEPRPDKECRLDKCPEPEVGLACCTPTGDCGADPFSTGAVCFANAMPVDAGTSECNVRDCPYPAIGFRCCAPDDRCGTDLYGFGQCAPNVNIEPPPAVDAGQPAAPVDPPDDPSITGECPSFLGLTGPVWGCCTEYEGIGICGTFQFGECLIPAGAPIPMADEDGGTVGCELPQ